jgi:acyl-CoA thioesterase I
MKSTAIFALLLLLMIACQSTDIMQQDQNPNTTANKPTPFSFLALGDSYTIGEAVAEQERWPMQLASQLIEDSIKLETPKIIAKTGWTTAELQGAIANELQAGNLSPNYDLVSLLIGVNNQYRGYDFQIYEKEFEALLQQAIGFAGGNAAKVFVVSIPDYGVTPFAANKNPEKIAAEIDRYNAKAKEIASAYQVQYVDITPISREASTDTSLIAQDGLHPSGKMYASWVSSIKPIVIGMLD